LLITVSTCELFAQVQTVIFIPLKHELQAKFLLKKLDSNFTSAHRLEISVFLGYDAASLGIGFPIFRNEVGGLIFIGMKK